MKCLSCQSKNPDNQEFCGQCGAKLEKVCPDCGAGNPPHYVYCGRCRNDLSDTSVKPRRSQSRKSTGRHASRNGLIIGFSGVLVVIGIGVALTSGLLPINWKWSPIYSTIIVQQPPNAPSGLNGTANSYSEITIEWIDNSNNEAGFRIFRNGSLVGSVGPNVTMFQDNGLQYGTTYSYKISAYNNTGNTESASTIQIKTLNPPIVVTLDKIGVSFDHDPLTKGKGEIYLFLAISDDAGEPTTIRIPPNEYIGLNDNEIVDVGEQVFSSDCIGDDLKILGVAFESDDPLFEGLFRLLTSELVSKIGGPAAIILTTIVSQNQSTEDNQTLMQLAESPESDDLVGAIEGTWTSSDKWGLGSYEDIRNGDLRLWFTISMPVDTTTNSPSGAVPISPAAIPPTASQGQETAVSFTVEPKEDQVFSINISNSQTLHLAWRVTEGDRVWFHITTPSGKSFGFYENGEFAGGTLEEGFCQGLTEGRTTFSPSQYGWGEGDYQVNVTSGSRSYVEVRYWIEE